jgi:subtilisin family serine protease
MRVLHLFAILITPFLLTAQSPTKDWFHKEIQAADAYSNLGSRSSTPVIVAVIDSGVDIEHEDLANNIWVNTDEIPGNGIDDDKNGYVDDINGWNFIGNADGTNINGETLEVTRLYASLRGKYKDANPELLTGKQLEEYNMFLKYKEEVETKREDAQNNVNNIEMQSNMVGGIFDSMIERFGNIELTEEFLDTADLQVPAQLVDGVKELVIGYKAENGEFPDFNDVKDIVKEEMSGGIDYYKSQANFHYNPDFKSREIIGDNYADQEERYYGNNDVEGPDAFHGTHVAGIIGAVRDNDIGMNGVASNVLLMSVRTVPDGDEHDKDVANAIRYAVDNGASIINMSFGKGYAWNKDVVDDAVRYAEKNDVLLVHAAGNSHQDNDTTDNFPNDKYRKAKGFLFWKKKKVKTWLEVGALSYKKGEDLPATFSNYGADNVDIFAPGVFIYATTPDNNYQAIQGTSMASPVVAGVAAVLRSYFPTLKAEQVKSIIMESSTPHNLKVKKPGTDEIVDFSSLSVSGGVVNMKNAVAKAAMTKGKKKIKNSAKIRA